MGFGFRGLRDESYIGYNFDVSRSYLNGRNWGAAFGSAMPLFGQAQRTPCISMSESDVPNPAAAAEPFVGKSESQSLNPKL